MLYYSSTMDSFSSVFMRVENGPFSFMGLGSVGSWFPKLYKAKDSAYKPVLIDLAILGCSPLSILVYLSSLIFLSFRNYINSFYASKISYEYRVLRLFPKVISCSGDGWDGILTSFIVCLGDACFDTFGELIKLVD